MRIRVNIAKPSCPSAQTQSAEALWSNDQRLSARKVRKAKTSATANGNAKSKMLMLEA
jgi:hypothetical protein